MKNINRDILDMIEYPKEGILSKELIRTENMNVDLFCMTSGKEISEHTSSKEGIVYVLEGKGKFVLEGKDIEMKPGVFIYITANAKHSLKAKEDTSFILVLMN